MDTYAVDPIWLVCVCQLMASVLFVCLAAAMPADRRRLTESVRTRGGGLVCALTYALYSAVPERALKRWGSPLVNGAAMLVSGLILVMVYLTA